MMESTLALSTDEALRLRAASAISWPAILAGAAAALAASLLLLALGSGLGFASLSPWAGRGVGAATFAISGAIWLIVTQWLSAAMGGYLAGRLRQRWLATHPHEVFFRDTAHGFLTWCTATVIVAALTGLSVSALASGAAKVAAPSDATDYAVDKLIRGAPGTGGVSAASGEGTTSRAEVLHIAAHALSSDSLDEEDRAYLTSFVASKAGLSQEDAQKRVNAFIAQLNDMHGLAKAAADQARKVAAQTAIYTALAMLIGAFIASVAGAIGGRLRDEHS